MWALSIEKNTKANYVTTNRLFEDECESFHPSISLSLTSDLRTMRIMDEISTSSGMVGSDASIDLKGSLWDGFLLGFRIVVVKQDSRDSIKWTCGCDEIVES